MNPHGRRIGPSLITESNAMLGRTQVVIMYEMRRGRCIKASLNTGRVAVGGVGAVDPGDVVVASSTGGIDNGD